MKILKFILLFIAFYASQALGQQGASKDLSKALHITDSFVPPKEVKIMRGNLKKMDWKAFDNKIIILDFFDTYCTACIKAMPKLQGLQNKLADKLQIFTVTWQDKPTMERFFNTNGFVKQHKINIPVIYSDSTLKSLFPHAGIPHVAIIYKGKVKAITMTEFITEENLLKLYESGNIQLPLKDDFAVGDLAAKLDAGGMSMKAGVIISDFQNGVPSYKHGIVMATDSTTGKFKSSFYNKPLVMALKAIWSRIKRPTYIPRPERFVLKVKDESSYRDLKNEGEVWLQKHGICYERFDLVKRPDSLQALMLLNDLHSYFGLKSYFDKKEMDCLVLRSCPVVPYDGPEIKDAFNYENSSVFATFLDISYQFPPAVDLVKNKTKMKIGGYQDLEGLNKQLRAYGIEAKVEKSKIEVFVIEEVN